MSVSRETERLSAYATLLRKWNPHINLIAPSTVDDLEHRHLDDCLQLARLARPEGGLWVDFGSGGGLPGIVLAIMAAESPTEFLLVESDQRKATFLRTVIRELGMNVNVKVARIESLKPLNADYISARALAPLVRLVPYLQQHLKPTGQAWLMKGENWQAELADASDFRFEYTAHSSQTQPGAAILQLTDIQR